MELHQLRYVRAIVRNGSVTRAAELEHVAQPSVSRQVRLLEAELGTPLFHRVGRGVVPTDAALELANLADRVFDDMAATTGAIAARDASAPATLHICATETVAELLLPAALAEVLTRFPRVSVSVEMLGTIDATGRVLADQADFAIVVLPVTDTRLEVATLFREDVLLAVRPGDAMAGAANVALADALARDDLLLSMRGLGLRAQVEDAAVALGVVLQSRVELRSQRALLAMVAAGAGATFAPRIALAGRDDVVALELVPGLTREVGWVRRRGRHLPAASFELLERIGGRGAGNGNG